MIVLQQRFVNVSNLHLTCFSQLGSDKCGTFSLMIPGSNHVWSLYVLPAPAWVLSSSHNPTVLSWPPLPGCTLHQATWDKLITSFGGKKKNQRQQHYWLLAGTKSINVIWLWNITLHNPEILTLPSTLLCPLASNSSPPQHSFPCSHFRLFFPSTPPPTSANSPHSAPSLTRRPAPWAI